MTDLAGTHTSLAQPPARHVRWPFDPVHPLALLATVLSTVAVLAYLLLFLADFARIPAILILDDPVRSLARLSEAERLMTQAAKGLPRWVQDWTVGTVELAREDTDRRWDNLVAGLDVIAPSEVGVAELSHVAILAGWGDPQALEQLRSAPAHELDDLPPELRQSVGALLEPEVAEMPPRSPAEGRPALAFVLVHEAIQYALMLLGGVALAWWLIRGRPFMLLGAAPRAWSFGLLRGYQVWICCKLIVVAIIVFLWMFGDLSDSLSDGAWELLPVLTGVSTLLLVRYGLLRPRGRTLLGLFSVTRGRIVQMLSIAVAVVGFKWLFCWGLWLCSPAPDDSAAWADFVDETMFFGPTWLWLLDSMNAIVTAPLVEEVLYRGVLYAALRSRLSVVQAAVVSAVVFAGAHGYDLVGFLTITFCGFMYALTYEFTRSLAPCALAHAINNLSAVIYPLPWVMI